MPNNCVHSGKIFPEHERTYVRLLGTPEYFQSKVLKYRARANRKTLKCPKMISKTNFRNFILKNYEEYLI